MFGSCVRVHPSLSYNAKLLGASMQAIFMGPINLRSSSDTMGTFLQAVLHRGPSWRIGFLTDSIS